MRHPVQVVFMLFQKLHQICRSPGLKPVAAVLSGFECIEQAERVVYSCAAWTEVVSVIVLLQLSAGLLESLPVGICKSLDIIVEVLQEFFFSYPADICIERISGYILEIVQVAEHAYLTELRHPGQKGELDIAVH